VKAEEDEDMAKTLRDAEAEIRSGIVDINEQLPILESQRDDLDNSISDKQKQIDDFKAGHPECF
jgi:predicted ribonuclease toxin of YeeF-YezG toxin-antitoxin module